MPNSVGGNLPAVILCGGRGTRIAALSKGLPKSMMPIAGRPFIALLIERIATWGIDRFVLCTGMGGGDIARWANTRDDDTASITLIEDTVIGGTLAPVRHAFATLNLEEALILNGDTMIYGDVGAIVDRPLDRGALCRVGMTWVDDTERYGRVEADDGRLRSLSRGVAGPGHASNGMLRANAALFDHATPEMTGIDDLVAAVAPRGGVTVARAGDRFVDIGTPSGYEALRRDP